MSTAPMLLRIVPPVMFDIRRPQRMVERSVYVYRRSWMIFMSGLVEPLFYLLSIRVGLDALVGEIEVDGRIVSYDQFVAPGLLASAAMNGAVYECTGNILHKIRHSKLYDAVLSTPMSAGDVALGEVLGAVLRSTVYAGGFVATMWFLGMVESAWIVMAVPVAALIGAAFASLSMAATTYMRGWEDMEFVPAVTLPLFLFSATFYPVSQYGDWAWAVQLSPLYHGVELVRAANAGSWNAVLLVHAAVLAVLALVGLAIASTRIERLLLT